ncbi:lambda family phage tail tape measure protein [Pseudomonas psychrophila]|nr:lambda family phage tail tape measure protein [Pseudomonas psychrophila]
MSASGVSAEAAAGALVQLGQAFASGVLRGQELNSVLEQAPGLARSIADGLGVAVGDLRKLGEAGAITSEKLFRSILSQGRSIDDQFARSQTSIKGAFTVLENSLTKYVGTMDQVTGASTTATSALLALSKSLDSAKFENFSKVLEVGLYVVLGRVAGGLLSSAYAMRVNVKAAAELTLANSIAAAGEVRRLEAVKAGVVADLARARSSVASAEASVMASRQVQTADLARLQTVRQSLVAELELEQQRLRAQISDIGRQQSVARMAELRLAETAIIRQLTAAEAQLTATTIAGSAAVTASLAQRTAATEALAVVNGQLAVAQVAATSTMAAWAASSTALGAAFAMAAKAGRALLSLAAGWPGLIITVGLIAYSFLDFGDKAEEGTSKAANAFDDASTRIRRAVKGMLPDDLGKRSFEQLSGALDGLQSELKNAEEVYDRLQSGADSGGDVPFALPLDQAGERVEALKGAIQKTQAELNGVRFASDKAGQSYLDSLKKQAVVAGKLTEVEKLRAQLSAGILKLDPESEKEALKHAAAIDKVNASLKMQKADTKSVSEVQKKFASTEEDYQRQIELINTTTDARKNATEVAKLQFEIESGKLVGINALQQKRLEGLAVELDSLKQLKQANEDAAKLAAFGTTLKDTNQTISQGFKIELSGAGSGDKLKERLQADLEIQQEHDKQVSDLFKQRNAGDISKELYKQETELLSEALAERMVIQQDYYNQLDAAQSNWMDGVGDAWNNYLDQSRDISGQTKDMFTDAFSGMNDALYNFVTTGKLSFSDMAATFASSALKMLIQWGTAQVAMAALNAFTSTAAIPIVGPFAAPAAAASALGAAGSFMGMIGSVAGMAHDGIDAVPETGTWLLQKGERVTTAQTSAKLDRTLEQVAQGGGAGGKGLTVNLIEDRSRAGQSERGTNSDGSEYLNLWAAQIRSGGNEASDSLEAAYGLKRQAG